MLRMVVSKPANGELSINELKTHFIFILSILCFLFSTIYNLLHSCVFFLFVCLCRLVRYTIHVPELIVFVSVLLTQMLLYLAFS